jgi:hypothetical protein
VQDNDITNLKGVVRLRDEENRISPLRNASFQFIAHGGRDHVFEEHNALKP